MKLDMMEIFRLTKLISYILLDMSQYNLYIFLNVSNSRLVLVRSSCEISFLNADSVLIVHVFVDSSAEKKFVLVQRSH